MQLVPGQRGLTVDQLDPGVGRIRQGQFINDLLLGNDQCSSELQVVRHDMLLGQDPEPLGPGLIVLVELGQQQRGDVFHTTGRLLHRYQFDTAHGRSFLALSPVTWRYQRGWWVRAHLRLT